MKLRSYLYLACCAGLFWGCSDVERENAQTQVPHSNEDSQTRNETQTLSTPHLEIKPDEAALLTASQNANAGISPELAEGITLSNWASELLVADPVALDIDDYGRVYFTRTHRQKNSEFDIRGHREWEAESVQLQTVEDKRQFLKKILSDEVSEQNQWLRDLNKDGSHDWRDMRIEKEQVFRVEDTNRDGIADTSLLVLEDFNDETTDVAGALLVQDDKMYVGVGPDMWQLGDSDGDGVMDQKLSMAYGFGIHVGFSGHGMSGAETGPDGRIYWGIGDIGFNGKGNDKDGKLWSYPNRGVVVRANPDGTDFEVFAMGVRNTHEFAFDELGNLISVDNDGDHPGESERIVYLTDGSDTGWRINWQLGKYRDPRNNTYKVWMDEKMYVPEFKGQAAHITPTIANYVNGPTGMVYNPGTALSSRWKNHFFVAEFVGDPSRSGVHAFQLTPKGASFSLQKTEKLVGGLLATGMEFGPDGALYLADWIEGWKTKDAGRIWKLDDPEGHTWLQRLRTAELLPQDFSLFSSAELAKLLENPDMRIRQKAQFALVEHKDDAENIFKSTLENSELQLARIHAIWGLSQLARKTQSTEKNNPHAQILLSFIADPDPEIRAQVARWLGDMRYSSAADKLLPLLTDDYARARFFAAEALGRIAFAEASTPIISMLRENNDEDAYLRHAGSLALARIGDVDRLSALAADENEAVRVAAVIALRRLANANVALFLNDESERLVTEAVRAIHDDASIPDALPKLGNFLLEYKGSSEAILRRAISANLRVADESSMNNLLSFIENEDAPSAMREEAMAALGTWTEPSIFDRVDGQYRGHIERDGTLVRSRSEPVLTSLMKHENAQLRAAGASAIGTLNIANAAELLFASLSEDSDSSVRVAVLGALATMNDKHLNDAISLALQDKSSPVRSFALTLLDKSDMSHEVIARLLSNIFDVGTVREKQAALVTLAKLTPDSSREIFSALLTQLGDRKLPDELVLDLAEAIAVTDDPDLKNSLGAAITRYASNDLEKKYPGMLNGGDPANGRNIFLWHQSAQCTKCHSIWQDEDMAGPNLKHIATTLTNDQLLEALVDPSARIAPGFGSDGGPSSMPNMSYFLSQREIRDLISFLGTLKEK